MVVEAIPLCAHFIKFTFVRLFVFEFMQCWFCPFSLVPLFFSFYFCCINEKFMRSFGQLYITNVVQALTRQIHIANTYAFVRLENSANSNAQQIGARETDSEMNRKIKHNWIQIIKGFVQLVAQKMCGSVKFGLEISQFVLYFEPLTLWSIHFIWAKRTTSLTTLSLSSSQWRCYRQFSITNIQNPPVI